MSFPFTFYVTIEFDYNLLKLVKNCTLNYSNDSAKGYNYNCIHQYDLVTDYIV